MKKKLILKCLDCGILLTQENWPKVASKGGWRICYSCFRVRNSKNNKIWKKENPEKYKNSIRKKFLKRTYDITIEQYDQMLQRQNGVCAICEKVEEAKNQFGVKRLQIDHDHKTGKIRGLLCQKCNFAIGNLMADDLGEKLFINAIQYLNKNKT